MQQPDPIIVSARRAQSPVDPSPNLTRLWDGLQAALNAYDVALVTSLSSEGVSRGMDAKVAATQVAEWWTAYSQELADSLLETGTDPVLTTSPMGFTVDHSQVALRF